MIRIIIYSVIIYLLIRVIKWFYPAQNIPRKHNSSDSEHMVKDPNCNSYIPEREAIKKMVKGKLLSFCSKECMEKYKYKN